MREEKDSNPEREVILSEMQRLGAIMAGALVGGVLLDRYFAPSCPLCRLRLLFVRLKSWMLARRRKPA